MRSVIALSLAVTLLSNASLKPAPAEAAIGVLMGPAGAPVILAGGIAAASGAATLGAALIFPWDGWWDIYLLFIGGALLIGGLIVLDESSGPTLRFVPIGEADARRLSISPAELEDFNSSLDELNAMVETVHHEVYKFPNPTVQDSAATWERYRAYAPSEAAYLTASKVAADWVNQITKTTTR
ncbi:MAG TPA: hypothetical protein VM598_05300 [Bdellovibrionota bacterium]|nr:hypothetical protein [Bdellovibrionota bacterium]